MFLIYNSIGLGLIEAQVAPEIVREVGRKIVVRGRGGISVKNVHLIDDGIRSETSAHSRWITSFQGAHLFRGATRKKFPAESNAPVAMEDHFDRSEPPRIKCF